MLYQCEFSTIKSLALPSITIAQRNTACSWWMSFSQWERGPTCYRSPHPCRHRLQKHSFVLQIFSIAHTYFKLSHSLSRSAHARHPISFRESIHSSPSIQEIRFIQIRRWQWSNRGHYRPRTHIETLSSEARCFSVRATTLVIFLGSLTPPKSNFYSVWRTSSFSTGSHQIPNETRPSFEWKKRLTTYSG